MGCDLYLLKSGLVIVVDFGVDFFDSGFRVLLLPVILVLLVFLNQAINVLHSLVGRFSLLAPLLVEHV